ncbi:MAG: GNAT family N-acetyltransferase [Chloroflexi bacterium]|nr:GNAT family N-acetyltransferase [Chloroflexota bacterium]
MRVVEYSDPTVFDELADEWDSLLDPARSDVFFLQNWWQRIWWQHLHVGQLAVFAIYDDDESLVCIASLFLKDGAFHFVGCIDVVDYLDMVCKPSHEEAAYRALIEHLCTDTRLTWNRLDLCNIPEDSPTFALLPQIAEEMGLRAETRVQEVCPVITLPESYDAYLATLDNKQSRELKRKRKRVNGPYDVDWYRVDGSHDIAEATRIFLDLMASSAPEKAAFLELRGHREFMQAVIEAGHAHDQLDLLVLTIDGTPTAAMLQFDYKDRVLLYNSGLNMQQFAALSPGILLLTFSVEDAIERGFVHYDFLRGDEEYKFKMGAHATHVHQVVISA